MQKAEAQHNQMQNQPAVRQGKGAALESPQGEQIAQLEAMAESSPQAGKLAQLAAMVDASPSMAAQRKLLGKVHNSPALAVQRKAVNAIAQRAEAPAKPNNTGLPDNLKNGIESLSGMSMDNVKAHYNSSQPAQLNALAYAQGTDIHVAPGQEQHLPHEAWHVVQQAQGRVRPTMQMKVGVPVNDDAGLEHEADVMGARAMQMTARQEARPGLSAPAVTLLASNSVGVLAVAQRQVKVGGNTMSLADLKTQVMNRQNLTFREVNHVLRGADGKEWDSWGALGIWVALGLELMEMDEDKEGEFEIDATHSHTSETHTIEGIWGVRRVLTAHPTWVSIFSPGTMQAAIDAMPDRFTAWEQVDGERWDAELGGVHYQAELDDGVMELRTCYPVRNGITLLRTDVEKAVEMAQSLGEFTRLIMGLHTNDQTITAQVRGYQPKIEDWFARRMSKK